MQPVSLEEKCQIVQKGKERKMEVGETWYLVSRVWYKRWRKACTGEIDKEGPVTENELGPVDNSGLLDSYRNLQSPLAEGVDVEYVPQEVWDLFVQWWVFYHFLP
jgi:ubiquitin carboxyl-terminal hydrolase 4/11/15